MRRFVAVLVAVVLMMLGLPALAASAATGFTLTGTVTDSTGHPLSAVKVVLTTSDLPAVTTSTAGVFTISGTEPWNPPGRLYAFGSTARGGTSTTGYLDNSVDYIVPPDAQGHTTTSLQLDAAGGISGTVTETSGGPLANVTVHLSSGDSGGLNTALTTASDGTYSIVGIRPGYYFACFDAQTATGYHSATGLVNQCWKAKPGPFTGDGTPILVTGGRVTMGISPSIDPAGVVAGTVTDAQGMPVAGVEVWVQSNAVSYAAARTETAADGTYRIADLTPSDQYTVCFDARMAHGGSSETGYLSQCNADSPIYLQPGDAQPELNPSYVSVTNGRATAVDAHLDAAALVKGVVTNSAGQPIPGVQVTADGSTKLRNFNVSAITDANGAYTIGDQDPQTATADNQLPAANYTLLFGAGDDTGYLSEYFHHDYFYNYSEAWGSRTTVTAKAGVPTTVNEDLVASGSISGVVKDAVDGTDLLTATAYVSYHGKLVDLFDTGVNGSYQATRLPPAVYTVCFGGYGASSASSAAGYLDQCDTPPRTINLSAGEHLTGIDSVLPRASRITGTVTDTSGASVWNTHVTIDQADGTEIDDVYTNSLGVYKSDRLPAGRYTVCFHNGRYDGSSLPAYIDQCFDAVGNDGTPTPVVTTAGLLSRADAVLDRAASVDTTAPTVTVSSFAPFQLSTTIEAGFSATDAGSGVASYDARYRVAGWNADFGAYRYPTSWQQQTESAVTINGLAGHTYCVSVRARDQGGNVSGWSAERCTAVPVDERALPVQGVWSRLGSRFAFDQTLSRTTTVGAGMTLHGARGTRLGLVVTTCSSCGDVGIYLNGLLWITRPTYSATTRYGVVMPLPPMSLRTVSVTVRSRTRGKEVILDAVGATQG